MHLEKPVGTADEGDERTRGRGATVVALEAKKRGSRCEYFNNPMSTNLADERYREDTYIVGQQRGAADGFPYSDIVHKFST